MKIYTAYYLYQSALRQGFSIRQEDNLEITVCNGNIELSYKILLIC